MDPAECEERAAQLLREFRSVYRFGGLWETAAVEVRLPRVTHLPLAPSTRRPSGPLLCRSFGAKRSRTSKVNYQSDAINDGFR
jgi:hypothetical protein